MLQSLAQTFYTTGNEVTTTAYTAPPAVTFGSYGWGILSIVGMWKVFEKAGKPGWAAIIPIYNLIVMLQIIDVSPWAVLLVLVPIVNIVFLIIWSNRLGKAFGKSSGWSFFLLALLSPIGYLILGFGDATYQGPLKNVASTTATPATPSAPTTPTATPAS